MSWSWLSNDNKPSIQFNSIHSSLSSYCPFLVFQALPLSFPLASSLFILGLTLSLSNGVFAFSPRSSSSSSSSAFFSAALCLRLARAGGYAGLHISRVCVWVSPACVSVRTSFLPLNARARRLPGYHQRPSLGCHLNGLPRLSRPSADAPILGRGR